VKHPGHQHDQDFIGSAIQPAPHKFKKYDMKYIKRGCVNCVISHLDVKENIFYCMRLDKPEFLDNGQCIEQEPFSQEEPIG
jgi:hypothetical protein